MVKLVAIYKQPEDQKSFDKYYFEKHIPINNQMPGLLDVKVTRFIGTPMGTTPDLYLQADMYFESMETLQNAMKSPEGKASAKDVWSFAKNLVSMYIAEEVTDL